MTNPTPSRSPRVVIAGRGWAAVRTAKLLALLRAGGALDAEVACACIVDDDGAGGWLPSLRAAADAHGWEVHDSIGAAEVDDRDIVVSIQYDRVVREADLRGARAYNLHFSALPRYRGMYTSYWPLQNGELQAGVTLHELTPRLDAGPIVGQRMFPIDPFVTAYDIYRSYHLHGFELVREHLRSIVDGTCTAVPQADELATYHDRRSVDFGAVEQGNFARTAEVVRDHCRALIFPPAQLPTFLGRGIAGCYVVREWPRLDGAPGDIVGAVTDAVLVRCSPGIVCFELH